MRSLACCFLQFSALLFKMNTWVIFRASQETFSSCKDSYSWKPVANLDMNNVSILQYHFLLSWCWLQMKFDASQSHSRNSLNSRKRPGLRKQACFLPRRELLWCTLLSYQKSPLWNIKRVSFKNQSTFMFRIYGLLNIRVGCPPRTTG